MRVAPFQNGEKMDSHTHYLIILPSPPTNSKSYFAIMFSNFQAATSKQERTKTNTEILDHYSRIRLNDQAPIVQKVDNAIGGINLYPLDSAIGFPNTYPLDNDLSGG